MHRITLKNTSIELGVQSNNSEHVNEGLVYIDGTQWCALQEASVYDYHIQYKEQNHNEARNCGLTIKGGR